MRKIVRLAAKKSDTSGYRRSLFLSTAIVTLIAAMGDSRPACAQSVTGSGLSAGPIQSPNWNVGDDLNVGDSAAGTLTIKDGGKVSNNSGAVGSNFSGTVTVTGAGSSWESIGRLDVGLFAAGALQIEAGANVSSTNVIIGSSAQGDAVVTGTGTTLVSTTQLTVGNGSAGTLHIDNGASVTSNQGYIGANPGGDGKVFVTGPGANWWVTTFALTIGNFGTGSLTIDDGARVRADGGVQLGLDAAASGTLTLQGTAANRGVLETSGIQGGLGTANVTINGGLLRATWDNPTFFDNFGTQDITIGANGAIIDTAGHDIGISPRFVGAGDFIKTGAGMLTLTGNSGSYSGAAEVDGGTLAVNGVLGGSMLVNTAGRLIGTGQVGTTTNSGVIAPGYDGAMGTLTIQGNYASSGGRLEIATILGSDSSQTSRLVVNGTTSGSTQVDIINRGGLGAQTVEGIKIVDVVGASNGTFVLNGNYVFQGAPAVIAGAYAYRLYQGGVVTPSDGDWYLRSALIDPGPSGGSDNSPPLYQPGVPLYESYGANLQSLNTLSTLQQRVGNRVWAPGSGADGNGIWGRTESAHGRFNSAVSTAGLNQSIDTWKMQAGADRVLIDADTGRLIAGVNVSYGQANSQIHSIFGNGKLRTDGYGLGATLTWYGEQGFYVDGQAQVSRYNSTLNSELLGTLAQDNGGRGEAFSIEAGKRIAVYDKLGITPQFQMVYSNVRFDRFVDPSGAAVSADGNDSLRTRWGIAFDHQANWAGNRSKIYGIANVSYEWLDGMRTLVSNTLVNQADGRLWGELGLGASMNWRKDLTLYGEISANTPFRDFGSSYVLKGNIGLRAQL
jgi:fibronectin-binding autotransporter adhesin